MRSVRILLLAPALALAVAACSDTNACACTQTTPAPPATGGSGGSPDTSPATTPETSQASSESTVPGTALSGPVQIDVVVGVDSGPQRVEKVTSGSDITLNITNPNAADEYHVHGIDLEQKADQNVMATMNFTLDEPGTYEVESHVTDDVLLVIEVA